MSYVPRPIDTSSVKLPDSIHLLIECLSEHNHDVWARQRLAEGWTWGESRNDKLKQHPCLISYDELSEAEKQYDRNTAIETLKCIVALGFTISEGSDQNEEESR